MELFEAAVPAVSVLVAFRGVREHPMREGYFGRSAQVVKLNRDGRFLSGRIGGPAPGEYEFFGWLDLLVGAAELVHGAVFVAHLELVFAAHLQIEFRDDGAVVGGRMEPERELLGVSPGPKDPVAGSREIPCCDCGVAIFDPPYFCSAR